MRQPANASRPNARHVPPRFAARGALTLVAACWVGPGSALARQDGAAPAETPAAAPATAQPAPAKPAPVDPTAIWEERNFGDLITHRVFHLLRSIEAPTIEQYRAAALGLRLARRHNPSDAEILRAEIEAWDAAQDIDAALSMTRELVKLDPLDTVALLRICTARITGLQDADQRLKAYDGLINSKSLDASVRSRLALDAALLARETGDERGFLDRLLLSTSLDVTHKEAAALTVTTYLDKSKDPTERFDLLSSLLLADPHDPETYRNLSYELRRQMAFKAAARFLELARALNSFEGREPTAAQQLEYFQSIWDSMGPEKSLEQINKLLDLEIISERLRREGLIKGGRDPGPEIEIRLPPALERVRLMINVARIDDAGAESSVKSLEGGHNEAITRLATEPPRAPDGGELPVEQRGESIRRTLLTDWVWVRLFSGLKMEDVEKDLDELSKPGVEGGPALGQEAMDRFRGWLHVVRGELAEGRKLLEPLQDSDGTALWALGVAAQREGDLEKAAGLFERLAREYAAAALGSAGRQRWERIKGVPFDIGPVANSLNGHAARFAPWLERTVENARTFTSITVEPTKLRLDPFERADARLVLTNVSRVPMGLGLGRSINPRLLLGINLVIGGKAVSGEVRPEVVNLGRRLRLIPNERIDLTFWAGRGDLFRASLIHPALPTQMRWSVTQGFMFQYGSFTPGPNSIRAESEIFHRNPLRSTQPEDTTLRRRGDAPNPTPPPITAETLAQAVLNEPEPRSYRHLALACYQVGPARRLSDFNSITEPDARTLSAALTERLSRASAAELAIIIPRLEAAEAFDEALRSAALDAVKRLNQPALWVLAFTTVPESATVESFTAAAREAASGDADLSAFVTLAIDLFNPSKSAAPKAPEEGVQIVPVGGPESGAAPQGGQGPTP
ncbi:MAG: hypothetical protein ACKVZJ_07800 [Phycisphaerales bacterium]